MGFNQMIIWMFDLDTPLLYTRTFYIHRFTSACILCAHGGIHTSHSYNVSETQQNNSSLQYYSYNIPIGPYGCE